MKNIIKTAKLKESMNNTLFRLFGMFLILLFASFQSFGQSLVIDLQYNPMSFTNSQRTHLSGSDNQEGAVYKYTNVVTIDGHTIYAKMTILEMGSGMVIRNFDDDTQTGDSNRFQPRLSNTSNSDRQILYQLEFFDTATDWPVYLKNYWLTGVDIDGNGSLREYNEIGGYSSYTIDATNQLTITTNSNTGRTKFKGINYSLPGVTFENKASYMANFENANNKITFALGLTRRYTSERYFSVQFGQAGGIFPNPNPVNNPLPVAVDDYGIVIDKAVGGTSVNNILVNDLYDGNSINPSDVNITEITPASNSGVQLNTSTGEVTVDQGTPVGDYTIIYQICMVSDPLKCDLATIYVSVVEKKADLAVEKTVSPNPVVTGENLSYTIVVVNNGPHKAMSAVLTDVLPNELTLVSATPTVGNFSGSTWDIGDLDNAVSATLTIVASVDANFSGSLENTASVTSSTTDPNPNNNTSTVTVTVNKRKADLAIVKTASPNPVLADGTLTYTLTVTNYGPDAAEDITVADILPSGITFISATLSTGSWSVPNWTMGYLANGATATMTIQTTVNSNTTGTISNTAEVSSTTSDPNPNNNSSTKDVEVGDTPNIENEFSGTLAYEDLWPGKGDYDFNDLVLDYEFITTSNQNNYVVKVEAAFTIKAFGAGLQNGFGFQLSSAIDQADLTVSGYSLNESYITLNSNGTEDEQSLPTIIVFDNAYKEMLHPGVGIGVNTDPNAPYVTPKTINILITFPAETYSINDLNIANFNPFLIANLTRGHEVHLPDYAPTDLMDTSLFATFDDDSDTGSNKYFKTSSNLPWAINIFESFDYPIEKRVINSAFLHFIEWAESGGSLYNDWYMDKPGYRNTSNIYKDNTP